MARSIWDPKLNQAFVDAAASVSPAPFARVAAREVTGPAPFPSPIDWRNVWIYMIMTDRFNNPDRPPKTAWNCRQSDHFQGGTFEGVRQQLDYLRDLGAGAIWLTPVLKNCVYFDDTYHGYGIQDFIEIDPRLASDPQKAKQDPTLAEAELRALVDDAHARGIYVIFDIVLNHAGDVFAYGGARDCSHSAAAFSNRPYDVIRWRDADGCSRPEWNEIPRGPDLSQDAAVWPREFQDNAFFRRQGEGAGTVGDFSVLKQMLTDLTAFTPQDGQHFPVRNALIRAYQYLIAKYDVDAYRIDTLKYVSPDFARTFGNAMREYAASLGKYNFFTFGEVYDNEDKIAEFIGRNTNVDSDGMGVDASLDFPLFFTLPKVIKGQGVAPSALAGVYQLRKEKERDVVTSHGEAGAHFVTFLDNHDQPERFYYCDPQDPHRYDAQAIQGLACLFALQGIPCVYYGTEQGLQGAADSNGSDADVREALWGKEFPNAFDRSHPFYLAIQELARMRQEQPALRFGRQYFRPISGNGREFGISPFPGGVIAFSRILSDQEVLVVANTNTGSGWEGEVIVDFALNPEGTPYDVLYSNCGGARANAAAVAQRGGDGTVIHEANGSTGWEPVRVVPVKLAPMEVQYLSRPRGASARLA